MKNNMKKNSLRIKTRFAPSPTGNLHIGSARTALFSYLFTKHSDGDFVLRIEDTDKERSESKFEEDILSGLDWLGLKYDEFYRQSERAGIHKKYLQKMIEDGFAYEAEENKNATGKIIRFKNPNEKVVFDDLVRGQIEFDTTDLGDFVIAKDINTPLFHVAVVVDDFEMGITHIIRGDDHISNTPRQILIQRAIGAPEFIYAHIPLILATDKSKLSKRHGAVSVSEYKQEGYLSSAMNNFLALMGWNPGDDREIFSLEELISEFDISKVQKGGAMFNQEKLDWVNKEHIKILSDENVKRVVVEYLEKIFNFQFSIFKNKDMVRKLVPIVLERINKWSDIETLAKEGEWGYFFTTPDIDMSKVAWKDDSPEMAIKHLRQVVKLLESADFSSIASIKSAIWVYAESAGKGNVLWPTRYALSGRDKSPDPFTLAYILGRDESIARIQKVLTTGTKK